MRFRFNNDPRDGEGFWIRINSWHQLCRAVRYFEYMSNSEPKTK